MKMTEFERRRDWRWLLRIVVLTPIFVIVKMRGETDLKSWDEFFDVCKSHNCVHKRYDSDGWSKCEFPECNNYKKLK